MDIFLRCALGCQLSVVVLSSSSALDQQQLGIWSDNCSDSNQAVLCGVSITAPRKRMPSLYSMPLFQFSLMALWMHTMATCLGLVCPGAAKRGAVWASFSAGYRRKLQCRRQVKALPRTEVRNFRTTSLWRYCSELMREKRNMRNRHDILFGNEMEWNLIMQFPWSLT